jgi:23S rRNA (uracil1939-C5)-methyltransferase
VNERVACAHEDRCGGCPLLDRPYADQLAYKGDRVRAAFAAFVRGGAPADGSIDRVIPAHPIVAYRTRAKWMVGPRGELGLFAKSSAHVVVDTPHCRVLAPSLAEAAAYLRTRIAAAVDPRAAPDPLRPFDPARPDEGGLRAVDLRETRDGDAARVLVTLVVTAQNRGSLPALRAVASEILREVPCVAGVAVNFHDGDSPQVLGPETLPLAGDASAPDRVGRSLHMATFGSFAQAHRGQAAAIHALVAGALGVERSPERADRDAPPRILDVYGGSGAIGLGLAAAGAHVHLVESFGPAAAQALRSARMQGIDLVATSEDAATALQAFSARGERFDAAVLNPPRRGTSPATREAVARVGPARIAYVSCDPDTLARDLDHLARLGYRTAWIKPFDMIPLTDQVECVALLLRGDPAPPCVLWESAGAFAVEKAAHEPTVPQGEYASSLLARVRALPGAALAVPVHRLDVGTSGAVVFARRPEDAAPWRRALAAATTGRTALVAVRGGTPTEGTLASKEASRADARAGAAGRYRRVALASGHSVLHVLLGEETRHAPRTALAALGHPVLGDDRYGHRPTNRHFEEKHALDRTFVHVAALAFDEPAKGRRVRVFAPVPGDLRLVLARMGAPVGALTVSSAFGA